MHDRQTAVSHLSTVLLFLINATGNSDRFDRKNRSDGLLPGDQPENQRQDQADQQTGCQGKVKCDVFPFEIIVSRQPADPGDFARQQKNKPDTCHDQAQKNQNATDIGEIDSPVPSLR